MKFCNVINYKIISIICLCLLLGACEPMGPMPGRILSGDLTSIPDDWAHTADEKTIQLETSPGKSPYSVNLWGVGIGSSFYIVSANGADTKWARRIADNSEVRLRIGQQIYELRAGIVSEQSELDTVKAGFQSKYDMESSDDFPSALIYRLGAR